MTAGDAKSAIKAAIQTSSMSVRECLRAMATPLQFLKGVGPKRAQQLASLGLHTVEDLLYHVPFRYDDRRSIKKISAAIAGEESSFVGRLAELQNRYVPRRRGQMLAGVLQDDTGAIDLLWYRAPAFLINSLAKGQTLWVHGKVERDSHARLRIVHPAFEPVAGEDNSELRRILPVYVHPNGLSLTLLRKAIAQALAEFRLQIPSRLPAEIIRRHKLLAGADAVAQLHEPALSAELNALNDASSAAHKTVIFDELFYMQLGLGLRRNSRRQTSGLALPGTGTLTARMAEILPFKLTEAQRRVLGEIETDLASAQPMQRLLQGDVGSGKTMVAWFASLRVIDSGYQALWLAPTEILAEQHYRNLKHFADNLRISSALLTAATPGQEKRELLQAIARGDVAFVVGTHALIQHEVRAPRMGLGVVDEQHRFGVMQRLSLQRLVEGGDGDSSVRQPHMLLMSATPIPRSLAMVLYGDLEVSFVDEMPPGRTPVRTKVFGERERKQVYTIVLEQLKRGHQAFVVLPLVEASEQMQQVRDATQMAEKMRQTLFKDFGIGLVHGRMSPEERDGVMRSFRDGTLGILVATTVVEVGIDIPNATVMVVEHAERFGLSQLHQLRGRVGRGAAPGYCLLVNRGTGSAVAAERLRVMATEHDGFKIAEADLNLRGAGELLGTRQSGLADFRLANLSRDSRLLVEARKEALSWLEKDPQLRSRESAGMRELLKHRWGARLQLGTVG
jgi:ATP-dependent DNA helicase RecG